MLDSLVRVSRRGKENHFVCPSQNRRQHRKSKITKLFHRDQPKQTTPLHSAQTASGQGNMKRIYTGFLRFHFSGFRYSLTLFSKFFASFPHGTCTLSVFHQYLALDGIYHPLGAAIPNNSTRRHQTQKTKQTGVSPSKLPCSKGLGSVS